MVEICDLTLEDTLAVVKGMRQWDRRCMVAQLGRISDEEFAINRFSCFGPAWAIRQDGKPVAVGGVSLPNAWAGTFWFIATDEMKTWGKLMRQTLIVLRNVTDPTHPEYRHRVEAHTIEGWAGAESLVRHLGFEHECLRKRVGSGGEGFNVWSMTGPAKEL